MRHSPTDRSRRRIDGHLELMAEPLLRIAFLHLAPSPGAVAQNRHLVTRAITKATCAGAGCIITPELAVSGYTFADTVGTDWIASQPDHWMSGICRLTARLGVTLFLSHPEQDPRSHQLYNTLFAIGPDGRIAGRHRKINALRVGSEAWSTPGTKATAFRLAPFGRVGLLICADAYTPGIAKSLKAQGAKSLSPQRPGRRDCTVRTASGNAARKTRDCRCWSNPPSSSSTGISQQERWPARTTSVC